MWLRRKQPSGAPPGTAQPSAKRASDRAAAGPPPSRRRSLMHPGLKPMEAVSTACLLDAARVEGLFAILRSLGVEPRPLYTGPSAGQLAAVAPYLVPCSAGSPFNHWFFRTGWGRGLGVAVVSPASMEELYSHFRQFLLVLDEAGKRLYFRFYDPR